jgi:molecular chaperone HscB
VRSFAGTCDFFAVLQVPRTFAISNAELKQSYHKLMADLHPDRQSQKSVDEQAHAAVGAAQVTNAYNVLSNPHQRAMHMLDLVGKPLDEASGTKLVGMDFLVEIMQLREDIASATNQEEMVLKMKDIQVRVETVCSSLAAAFEDQDLEKALQLTAQLQYWNRVDEILREKIDVS